MLVLLAYIILEGGRSLNAATQHTHSSLSMDDFCKTDGPRKVLGLSLFIGLLHIPPFMLVFQAIYYGSKFNRSSMKDFNEFCRLEQRLISNRVAQVQSSSDRGDPDSQRRAAEEVQLQLDALRSVQKELSSWATGSGQYSATILGIHMSGNMLKKAVFVWVGVLSVLVYRLFPVPGGSV